MYPKVFKIEVNGADTQRVATVNTMSVCLNLYTPWGWEVLEEKEGRILSQFQLKVTSEGNCGNI